MAAPPIINGGTVERQTIPYGDRALVDPETGRPSYAFYQWAQRISGGFATTVANVTTVVATVNLIGVEIGTIEADIATLDLEVAALEAEIDGLASFPPSFPLPPALAFPPPPLAVVPVQGAFPPVAAPPLGLTPSQAMGFAYFFGGCA